MEKEIQDKIRVELLRIYLLDYSERIMSENKKIYFINDLKGGEK